MSLFVSEDTFHQKLTVPGPVTVVCRVPELPSPTAPLRAASTPSCVTTDCPIQGGEPLVVQTQAGVSKVSANETNGVTVRTAPELVVVPAALPTTTEYVPACAGCSSVRMSAAFVASGIGMSLRYH